MLGEAGLEGIRKSIIRRHNTVTQYIVTRPILDLWKRANWRLGARLSRRWWKQDGIDLERARKWAAKATTRSETDWEEDSDGEPNGVVGGEEESQGTCGSSGAEWSGGEDG